MDERAKDSMAQLARRAYEAGHQSKRSDASSAQAWSSELARFLATGVPWSLYYTTEHAEAVAAISEDAAFEPLTRGEIGMFVSHPTGGHRVDLHVDVLGMLDAAWIQVILGGGEITEERFVERALQNLAQLERLLTEHKVQAHKVTELSGLRLLPEARFTLPWGTVMTTPPLPGETGGDSKALLLECVDLPVGLSFEAEPGMPSFPEGDGDRLDLLVPLAFVLGTFAREAFAPIMAYRSVLVPYTGPGGGGGPLLLSENGPHVLTDDEARLVSEVAALIEANHRPQLVVAARRLVQSVQSRIDPEDVLIDAVTAWEALVGTDSETSFRVCAALTILLESDTALRPEFHKQLKNIYGVRSRVVHGADVKDNKVLGASRAAVNVAARAMLEIYRRGPYWTALESQARADRLILESH